jgi:hypothetical protein
MSPVPRPRKRVGCLGTILGLLILGIALTAGLSALFAPWNFYFGGHFHWTPGWQGTARIQSTTLGGEYFMWIRLNPQIPGYQKSPLRGIAYLCTPRGERFRLYLGGDMPRNHGTDLTGVPLHLYLSRRWQFSGDTRPHIDLYGSFGHSELIVEDRGSLGRAFKPDGTLYAPSDRGRSQGENVQITFKESTPWTLGPSCPAIAK